MLPALAEVALKVKVFLPAWFSLMATFTTFVLPAGIPPTFFEMFAPPPVTFRLTPVAAALPPLVIFAVNVGLLPFFALEGPITVFLLIFAFAAGPFTIWS